MRLFLNHELKKATDIRRQLLYKFNECKLHVIDHDLTETGAANLGRAIHQARKVVGDFLACD